MGFHEHKIAAFTHKITDLPDQPTLSPQELKARFDSSPEELRRAHNAVCDEGERLSARVEGIVTDTFGDTIDREMLSHELAAELDAKADEASVAKRLTELENNMQQQLAQKCEIYCGSYNHSGVSQTIELGFRPAAVIICSYSYLDHISGMSSYADIAIDGRSSAYTTIVDNGFTVQDFMNDDTKGGSPYRYIAFKPVG